ncbi:hypothetical protein SLEP1_g4370 [Rubroshorea leprosula]|uniref:Uncharacterized protein n=1 Tax=Rubroshorea leprosula TaxID=152421 RepID=A0AAV5HYZ6_9ROSI|nr:hypothetical protein SLEP1_g4370 [Rubroshorea leprosula]
MSWHASSGAEVTGIVARSCSHGHIGGVSSVQRACNATSRSASADMRVGASTSMRESGSASRSVDAAMRACGMRVLVLRHRVATMTLTYTRMQAQGGSRKMQRALLAEASISGPWREVRTGCMGACRSSRGRYAWARESVLVRDMGARTGKLGRGAGTHGRGMARGVGRPGQGCGTGSQSRHRRASTDGSGLENSKSSLGGLDKDQNSGLDKDRTVVFII